jgi:aminotransferase
MRSFVAQNVKSLRPSGIRRYFDIAAEMDDVVSLGIGEPDFVTPAHITAQGIASLQQGHTSYTANAGMRELRQAISGYIERLHGLHYSPDDQVLVTVGVSEALFLAMKAILNPGEEVLVVEPCFVANPAAVEMAGGVAVPVDTCVENNFQVTAASLEARITARTKAVLLSYPNNPTGAVLSERNLREIAAVVEKYDLVVVADEIYERLVYDHQHICFAALPGMFGRTILLSGLSKSFAMTGWRVGYATAPTEILSAMRKLHQYLIMSAPTMSQEAALQALQYGDDDVEMMRAAYDARRRLIVSGFNDLGLTCFEPRGAFYAFPDISSTGLSSAEFCERLLLEERVALIPGDAFGRSGAGFVRASYATSTDNIEKALDRLGQFMRRHTAALALA